MSRILARPAKAAVVDLSSATIQRIASLHLGLGKVVKSLGKASQSCHGGPVISHHPTNSLTAAWLGQSCQESWQGQPKLPWWTCCQLPSNGELGLVKLSRMLARPAVVVASDGKDWVKAKQCGLISIRDGAVFPCKMFCAYKKAKEPLTIYVCEFCAPVSRLLPNHQPLLGLVDFMYRKTSRKSGCHGRVHSPHCLPSPPQPPAAARFGGLYVS